MSSDKSYRQFLLNITVTVFSFLFYPWLSSGVVFFNASLNDKAVFEIMGANSRGMFTEKSIVKLPNVEIGCICYVDTKALDNTIAEI